jgi:co-chaperonin GroES (HSP10)
MDMEVPPTVSPYSTGLDVKGRSLDELFPVVDPQFKPFGSRVLIQLRRVILTSRGGIQLLEQTGDTEAWNMQVGKIIAMGPLAFKNRKTADEWPEGMWAGVGDYVRFPRWGGDRLSINLEDGHKPVVVLILNDHDLLGAYEGDPRDVRAYLE